VAALGTTSVDDRAASAGFHANAETVSAFTPSNGGLIRAFHAFSLSLTQGENQSVANHCEKLGIKTLI
jgi:hypothetical protein